METVSLERVSRLRVLYLRCAEHQQALSCVIFAGPRLFVGERFRKHQHGCSFLWTSEVQAVRLCTYAGLAACAML